jgi:Spy/CpxP family protein refolding chaperone
LRLEANTTEAGFLAAFCDVSAIPTFIVIQNGQLQLQLKSDVPKDEFINAVRQVLGADPIPGSSPPQPSASQEITAQSNEDVAPSDAEDDLYGASESHVPASRTPAAAPPPSAQAKGKQKATSAVDSIPSSSSMTAVQQAARDALRKKKQGEAEELARIKARIEADRAARRAQAEARKAEREQERSTEAQSQTQPRTTSSRGSQAKMVNLQVRLFDGQTIRSTFPRTANLQDEVRKWVDEEFSKVAADDPNVNNKKLPPYFFRHILPPQPSREISAGDESQTLGDIDLAPSATLVLVPVKGYTEAYSGGAGGVVGTATGLVGGAFGLLSSTVGYVGTTIGSVIGYGSAPAEPQTGQTIESSQAHASRQSASDPTSVRVRTLADQRAREPRDQQFYNGNTVSGFFRGVSFKYKTD